MYIKLIVFTLLFIPLTLAAQTTVTGRVLDANKKGLDYYGVQVSKVTDSTVVFSSFFTTDKFSIDFKASESLILTITSYGYKDKTLKIDRIGQYDLNDIFMESVPILLGEVKIVGKIPLVSNKADRIIVNVQNSLLSEASDGIEMLQKTPGLIRNNNSIQVVGKGTPVIYIDKKKVNSLDEVGMINPQNIKSIEIVDNPPASFEADGHAIIIINTIKRVEDDYFKIGSDVTVKRRLSENVYIDGNKRVNNLFVSLYYGFQDNKSRSYEKNTREISYQDLLNSDATSNSHRKAHQYRSSFDYNISNKHMIGLQINGNIDDSKVKRYEFTQRSNYLAEDFFTISKNMPSSNQINSTLYYVWNIDSVGQKLDITTDYTQYNDKSDRDYYNIQKDTDIPFLNNNYNKNKNHIYTFTANYFKPIIDQVRVESGIKFYYIKRENNTNLSGSLNLTQDYISSEKNYAAYISGIFNMSPKLLFKIGVRAESNYRKGYKDNNLYIDTTQVNIFPSLVTTYKYKENRSIGFSYSSRITRPNFSSLDPSISADSLMNRMGNPRLKSTIMHSFQFSINPIESLILKTSYSYYNNPIYFMIYQDEYNPQMTNVRFSNGNNMHSYSISAMYNRDLFKVWSISLYTSYWQDFYKYKENNLERTNDKPGIYFSIQNTINLSYKIFTDIGFYYNKGSANGTFISEDNSNLYGSVRRNFLENKIRMSLSVNDILHKTKSKQRSVLIGRNLNIYNADNTYVRFSVSYQIGKSNYKKKDISSEEINRL